MKAAARSARRRHSIVINNNKYKHKNCIKFAALALENHAPLDVRASVCCICCYLLRINTSV
jgi:hypothetical protein